MSQIGVRTVGGGDGADAGDLSGARLRFSRIDCRGDREGTGDGWEIDSGGGCDFGFTDEWATDEWVHFGAGYFI